MNLKSLLLSIGLLTAMPGLLRAEDPVDFDKVVAPLLASRCLECHNASDRKGKLDLSSAVVFRRQDAVIVPGKLDESPLWQKVHDDEMPPKKPLTTAEKAILKKWIEGGAKWGKTDPIDPYAVSTDSHAGADWWSLQPVKRLTVPTVQATTWGTNPIDAFVLAKLEAKGLSPAAPASRRQLIRRIYFDLLGLPPTPKEIDDFEKDQGPRAYEKLIDRLLASPHYGERWARHWLDVARYTESQGFEYDRIRPNAWHYRDYVIAAFNNDKPYNHFVAEQIAGDVLNFASQKDPVTSEGIIATSLLVCGPWDQAGNSQANATQRMITREEELEDLVSVVGQSFLGLTINCARCHAHKYDPISHADYYRFKSNLEGVRHGEKPIASRSEVVARNAKLAELQRALLTAERTLFVLEQKARKASTTGSAGPAPLARWSFRDNVPVASSMSAELVGGATIRNNRLLLQGQGQYMRTAPLPVEVREKTLEAWVSLSTLMQGGGGVITLETSTGNIFDSIVYGERQPRLWMAGSNGFVRTRDLKTDPEASSDLIHVAIVYAADNSITIYRQGKPYGTSYQQEALQTYQAGNARVLLGWRHTGAGNGYLQGEIATAALYDRALNAEEVAASFAAGVKGAAAVSQQQMLAGMTEPQRQEYQQLKDRIATLRKEINELPPLRQSYVGIRQQPVSTRRLVRGDVTSPAETLAPGALAIIKTPKSDFDLLPNAPEDFRRLMLARWLTHPQHPLTARVMVNRLWHYHFGRGIVETPNDFGFNGARPTHPELLDWLAAEFVEDNWSIKHMHKLMLMSATYQQGSIFNEKAAALDSENTLLWRYTPRRLEGEIIRDAMLAVSGQLNRQMAGPSFRPFVVSNFNSDFYEMKDMIGPEYNRRTIYRIHVNSGKSALMDALDCPDPSIKTPARRVTTTPLAALALMNNSFIQRQAQHLAERVTREVPADTEQAIALAYELTLGRRATDQELKESARLVKDHGLPTLCWALLNSTEFLYVK